MLRLAILFLIAGLLALVLGRTGVGEVSLTIGSILAAVFLLLFVAFLVLGVAADGKARE